MNVESLPPACFISYLVRPSACFNYARWTYAILVLIFSVAGRHAAHFNTLQRTLKRHIRISYQFNSVQFPQTVNRLYESSSSENSLLLNQSGEYEASNCHIAMIIIY